MAWGADPLSLATADGQAPALPIQAWPVREASRR